MRASSVIRQGLRAAVRGDSVERAGVPRFLLDLRGGGGGGGGGSGVGGVPASARAADRDALLPARLQRFIGVIYRPDTGLQSHYAQASLARQFDAYAWFDRTRAVTPLADAPEDGEADTFPFGL